MVTRALLPNPYDVFRCCFGGAGGVVCASPEQVGAKCSSLGIEQTKHLTKYIGPDVQQIARLYSISSVDGNYGGCGGDNTALPRYEITLNGFDLQGGSASYPPRVCEYGNTDTGDFYFDDTTAIDWDNSCSYDW